jgi:hypothetical protein
MSAKKFPALVVFVRPTINFYVSYFHSAHTIETTAFRKKAALLHARGWGSTDELGKAK